jgi:signal transduction histidine kinase
MDEYAERLESFKDSSCNTRMWVIYQESRTPLSIIRGYAEILKKIDLSNAQGLPDNFHEMLDRIAEAERQISTLVSLLATYKDVED